MEVEVRVARGLFLKIGPGRAFFLHENRASGRAGLSENSSGRAGLSGFLKPVAPLLFSDNDLYFEGLNFPEFCIIFRATGFCQSDIFGLVSLFW